MKKISDNKNFSFVIFKMSIYLIIFTFIILNISNRKEEKINYANEIKAEYVFPKGIYGTKEMLFKNFFKDFYYYIDKKTGNNLFLKNKIYNINDFYDLAFKNIDSLNNDKTFGNLFGDYFLTKDIGGSLENQDDSFIGFCLSNNKYVDFIYFLKEFFYYWRLDEGYTGTEKGQWVYASDFLAKPVDSLIDTVKFFYYDKDNLPPVFIRKDNIYNLYDKIPGIVKDTYLEEHFDGEIILPDNLNCYMYKFIGWYKDKDFNEKIVDNIIKINDLKNYEKTEEDYNIYKIKIYAKFIKEE